MRIQLEVLVVVVVSSKVDCFVIKKYRFISFVLQQQKEPKTN